MGLNQIPEAFPEFISAHREYQSIAGYAHCCWAYSILAQIYPDLAKEFQSDNSVKILIAKNNQVQNQLNILLQLVGFEDRFNPRIDPAPEHSSLPVIALNLQKPII